MADISQDPNFVNCADALTGYLDLQQPPIAICFADSIPEGVEKKPRGRVPAGRRFWQDGATAALATCATDHELCAIGFTPIICKVPGAANRPDGRPEGLRPA